jgi:hypothetical protein
MSVPTIIILALMAGFVLGAAWHWLSVRERVVTVAAVRDPRPGLPCSNLHGSVEPGCRCPVCHERIGRADG